MFLSEPLNFKELIFINSFTVDAIREFVTFTVSFLELKYKINNTRACKIIDYLEKNEYISGYEGANPRKVLLTKEGLEKLKKTWI